MNDSINSKTLYIKDIMNYPRLTTEEEKKYGADLKLKSSLFLLDTNDERKRIDIKKLLSCLKGQKEALIILERLEQFLYDDFNNNVNIINQIKKYKDFIKSNNRIPNKEELKELFGIEPFDKKVSDKYLSDEVDKYIKYKTAVDKFVTSNLRLVVALVTREYKSINIEDELDLICQGNLILITYADRFDVDQGAKFSTYIYNCLKWNLKSYVLKKKYEKVLSFDINKLKNIKQFFDAKEEIEKKRGKSLTITELVQELNISRDEILGYYRIVDSTNHDSLKIDELHKKLDNTDIDAPNSSYYKDLLLDAIIKTDEDILTSGDISFLLKYLEKDEEKIIKMFFGIELEKALSLDAITKEMHISKMAVRKRLDSAIKKLRRIGFNNDDERITEIKNRM